MLKQLKGKEDKVRKVEERKYEGWSIRRVDKKQKGLSLQQRKRNRRNVQMTYMTVSVKISFFEWQSRWSKKD